MAITRRVLHDLGCVCGRHFCRTLYHSVDVAAHPGLRYAILASVLNVAQCPRCERTAHVAIPFLYSDGARGRLLLIQDGAPSVETEEVVRMVNGLEAAHPGLEDLPRPVVLMSRERLTALIAADLDADDEPAIVLFDVRPGAQSERAARLLAERLAIQTGGYAHSWREGGRLHLQILGPSGRLREMAGGVN